MLRGPRALLPQQPARLRHHRRALPLRQGQRLGELRALGLQGVCPVRGKHYISSSHLGLIKCLTPAGVILTIICSDIL